METESPVTPAAGGPHRLTTNLFWGQGDTDHRLDVIEGRWPTDVDGDVVIVGPDKRRPGGHWFDQQGLLARIRMRPDGEGRIAVRHRRLRTPVDRIRHRRPQWFRSLGVMEVSPFGLSNLANTNVTAQGGRLFVGYDAGRPIEVDPETLEYLTPVGALDEWMVSLPGLLEPGVAVAAHPAPDPETGRMWFVNSSPLPGEPEARLVEWDLQGPLRSWTVDGMSPFDSIHDVKATRHHLVFCDLPFVVEPESFRSADHRRTRPAGDRTTVRIVARSDLGAGAGGGSVRARELVVDLPTGHLSVDYDEPDGLIRLYLEHIPLQDLTLTVRRDSVRRRDGALMDPAHEGLVPLAVQPGCVGRYLIDPDGPAVVEADLVWDPAFWGAVLSTQDDSRGPARARRGQLWYSSLGFDPDMVTREWWELYGEAGLHSLVDPPQLPTEAVPASVIRIDREAMKVADRFEMPAGAIAHPPTFVPRHGSDDPDDGYLVAVVHADRAKEVWVFDAGDLAAGPLARAGHGTFRPPLLLHSAWMPPRSGPRPGSYRVDPRRDRRGLVRANIDAAGRLWRAGRHVVGARRGARAAQ